MVRKSLLGLCASVLALSLSLSLCGPAIAQERQGVNVRIAELEIDLAQLETYKAALREEIETSIRVEPGVLALYAVSEKDNPARIRIFEVYANEEAYRAHLKTPHFLKYNTGTQQMVRSLRLVETDPVMLGAKAK
jgi:quinol monooxygenase YgiN